MTRLHITLPVPPKHLQPNKKCSWQTKARLTKKARTNARLMALVALDRRPAPYWPKVRIRVTWFFRLARRRDEKNLDGWLKAYIDGLVDAGIMIDDNADVVRWGLTWIHIRKASNDEVLFTIEPDDGTTTENSQ